MSALSGALLLDKPSGITSARAVARVKRLLPKGTKVGHTGTLDPLASGLLVLLVGRATRLSRYVTGLDKSYTATARFGAISDTLDEEGEITRLRNAPMPDEAAIHAATKRFTGKISQIPPMASAVKIQGEPLYKAHRRGETLERESRPVTVHSLELLSLEGDTAAFTVSCSSGTYVRALISDLAESLDTGAYLTALRRTSVGHLHLENAALLEKLVPETIVNETIVNHIIQTREVVAHLPVVEIHPARRRAVCTGRTMDALGDGIFRVELEGNLLAIYREDGDGGARPEVVLCDP